MQTPHQPGPPHLAAWIHACQTRGPESFWNHSPALGITCVVIPKNACSAVTQWMMECDGHAPRGVGQMPRLYETARRLQSFERLTEPERQARLHQHPVIALWRDPRLRLVSAFRDKLITNPYFAPGAAIIAAHAALQGRTATNADFDRRISFAEVVDTVCALPDQQIEIHFRPQAWFVRRVPRDAFGLHARAAEHLAPYADRAGMPHLPAKDPEYTDVGEMTGEHAHVPAGELRAANLRPTAAQLLTPELAARLEARYANDMAMHAALLSADRPSVEFPSSKTEAAA